MTTSTRPLLVDLCCKAGGASMGYYRAGFDVVGIDLDPQPRYPFPFAQADLTTLTPESLAELVVSLAGRRPDAGAGSPPCKVHTSLRSMSRPEERGHVDLIPETRALLQGLGVPYVIENVPGAPLVDPLVLCGSEFGLGADTEDGRRHLRRHRLFESNVDLWGAGGCSCRAHRGRIIGVYGGGHTRPSNTRRGGWCGSAAESAQALGIDWMTRDELAQAIPPAYTEHLGSQLLDHLRQVEAA